MKDSLGDRMKVYEQAAKVALPPRMPPATTSFCGRRRERTKTNDTTMA